MFDGKVVAYGNQNEEKLQRENRGTKHHQELLVEEFLIFHE
jgi:hypothetical protein